MARGGSFACRSNRALLRLRRPPRRVRGIHRDGRMAPRARASAASIRPRAGRDGAGLPRRSPPCPRSSAACRSCSTSTRTCPSSSATASRAGAAAPHAPRHRRGPRLRGRRRRAHHRPRAAARALDRAGRAARQDHGRHELGGPAAVRSLSTSAPSLHGRRDAPADPPLQPPAHLRPGSGHRRAVRACRRDLDWRLDVYGDGPWRGQVEAAIDRDRHRRPRDAPRARARSTSCRRCSPAPTSASCPRCRSRTSSTR